MKKILFLITITISTTISAQFHWAKSMNTPDGVSGSINGTSIKTDAVGNVYTTGYFQNSIDFDPGPNTNIHTAPILTNTYFIQKLDSNGNLLWVHSFPLNYEDHSSGNQLTLDKHNNVYVTGHYSGTIDFDPGPGTHPLTAEGSYSNNFIHKFDSAGNFKWIKSCNSIPTFSILNPYSSGTAIDIDNNQNLIVTGKFHGDIEFEIGLNTDTVYGSGLFIYKMDTAGNGLWVKKIDGFGITSLNLNSVCSDSTNNIYITGSFTNTVDFDPGLGIYNATENGNNAGDIFIEKLDSNGDFQWVKTIGGPSNGEGREIKIDNSNNLIITGSFSDTVDFDPGPNSSYLISQHSGQWYNPFILKLSNSGDFIWAKGNFCSGYSRGWSLATDSFDNIYSLGEFTDSIDLDPGIDSLLFDSHFSAMFIQKFDSAGNLVWAIPIDSGYLGAIHPWDISIDANSHLYITGNYSGTVDFDPSSNPNILGENVGNSIFVLKIGLEEIILGANPVIPPDPTGIRKQKSETISIYPNPSNNQLSIKSKNGFNQILISNSTGAIIKDIKSETNHINISNLSPGIYFIRLIGDNETVTRKFIKN